jgi:hypothetical protein
MNTKKKKTNRPANANALNYKTLNQYLTLVVSKLELLKPNFFITWFVVFFISYLRATELFDYPSFWAEDGTYFFKESLELGFASIYTPIVGHFHTIPRILAYIGTFFPIEKIPLYYIVTAGLVSSACCAYFVREGFAWIVKPQWLRFFLAILISLLPGSEEIFFAYCTMNYILFIWITMFFLEDYQGGSMATKFREFSFATIWFSAGQGIVFLPVLAYQIFRKNYYRIASMITLLISVTANLLTTRSLSNRSFNVSSYSIDDFPDLLTVYFDNVFMRFIYIPILNHLGAHNWAISENLMFYILGSVLLGYFIFRIFRSDLIANLDLKINFILLILFTPIVFVLIYLVRGYVSQTMFKEGIYFVGRYAMQPFFIVFILYLLLLKIFSKSNLFLRLVTWIFTALIFFNTFWYNLEFTSPRLAEFEQFWPQRAKEIETAIEKVRIKKISTEERIGMIRCRPIWWGDLGIKEIIIK